MNEPTRLGTPFSPRSVSWQGGRHGRYTSLCEQSANRSRRLLSVTTNCSFFSDFVNLFSPLINTRSVRFLLWTVFLSILYCKRYLSASSSIVLDLYSDHGLFRFVTTTGYVMEEYGTNNILRTLFNTGARLWWEHCIEQACPIYRAPCKKIHRSTTASVALTADVFMLHFFRINI